MEFSAKGVDAVKTGIQAAGVAVGGFAAAGMHSAVEGERMALMMGHLSREIASLFLPIMEALTNVIQSVTVWMQNLSGTQQQFLGFIGSVVLGVGIATKAFAMLGISVNLATAGIAAALGVVAIFLTQNETMRSAIGKVMEQFMRIVDIIGPPLMQLFEAFADLVISVVVPALEVMAEVLQTIADTLQVVGEKLGLATAAAAHRSVSRSGGGTEGVADTYRRIQQAAIRGDVDYPRRQTELLGDIAKNTAKTNDSVQQINPAIGQ